MRAQAGPAQSPSQRSLGGHSLGPASPMSDSLGLPANEAGAIFPAGAPVTPPQDRMDDECALRYACSLAVKHGVYQVREFPTMSFVEDSAASILYHAAAWFRFKFAREGGRVAEGVRDQSKVVVERDTTIQCRLYSAHSSEV
jgi:hypothetical protein